MLNLNESIVKVSFSYNKQKKFESSFSCAKTDGPQRNN